MSPTRPKRPALKRRFSEPLVRNLKPKDDAYLVWDTVQRGLAVRVRTSGHKAYYAVYSRHGRPRWLLLGGTDIVPIADARTMAAEALLAVAKGGDPAAEKKAERGAGTFAELHARYVEEHAKKHNKSWKQAEALIRRSALPRWGKLQAASISRADVKQMMARIEAPIAANQTLAAVSAVFTWGMKEEIVAANPCKLVARNPTKDRERVLAESEVPLFWKVLVGVDSVTAAVLKTVLLTGQRPGEVVHMRREHLRDGWWEMPGLPVPTLGWLGTKNAQTHRVWLPSPVRELVSGFGNGGTGFVFASPRGGPVGHLDVAMRIISAKLGGDPIRPHDLRRTHGTTVTKLKFGRDAMNRIQNHIEGGIADVYDQHEYAEENKHIMEAVAARIMTLVEGGAEDGKVIHFLGR
jgi:integrase